MRNIYRLLIAAVVAGMAAACSTDIETPEILGFDSLTPKELSASKIEVLMEGLNEYNEAVTFTWGEYELSVDNTDYGVPDESVKYYLEMSPTPDFAVFELTQAEENTITFTERDLNTILMELGYQPKQQAPLYVRVRYAVADNVEYQYSKPVELNVSAFGIRLNRMDLLTDKEDPTEVYASIWSPEENGVYSGYVFASEWMNFWLLERDNTLWGNQPDVSFKMSDDDDYSWNLWFPREERTFYRMTVNTNTAEWTAEWLTAMEFVSSSNYRTEMTFNPDEKSWSAVVATTGAETFRAEATTMLYNKDNKDGTNGDPIVLDNIITIPNAGNWTVTVTFGASAEEQPKATYTESDTPPVVTYEPCLYLVGANWDERKCRLFSSNNNGQYMGFYYNTEAWENSYFATEDKSVIYGSKDGSEKLDTSDNRWAIYLSDESTGLNLYYVNLPEGYWSPKKIESLVVRGGNDLHSVMTYDSTNKVWTATLEKPANGWDWGFQILFNDKCDGDIFKSKGDGKLGYNEGDNIMPPSDADKYRFTINLYDMENLTYKFEAIQD